MFVPLIVAIALAVAIGGILFILLFTFMDSMKRALQIAAVLALFVFIVAWRIFTTGSC